MTPLRGRRRIQMAAALTFAAAAVYAPTAAQAGAYDVQVCRNGYGNSGALSAGGAPGFDWLVRVTNNCDGGWHGWNGISASVTHGDDTPRNEPYVPNGTSANIYTAAPAGAGIRSIHVDDGRLASYYGNTTGWNARVMVPSLGWCRTDGDGGGWCNLGYQRPADNSGQNSWDSPGYPGYSADIGPITGNVADLAIGVVCNGGSTIDQCYRPVYKPAAGVAIVSAAISVVDDTPPAISGISGQAANGGWNAPGNIGFGVTGWDNTGIQMFEKFVDGAYVGQDNQPCNYGAMKPCNDQAINSSVPVGGNYDGAHTVMIRARSATQYWLNCAVDCADAYATVYTDGNAPDAPASKNSGPAWSNANSFALNAPTPASENDPDGGGPQARSPIARRVAVICPGDTKDGPACVTKDVAPVAGGTPASAAVAVPAEGAWNARIFLIDSVGNGGNGRNLSAPIPVRLDQSPPTAAVSTSPLKIIVKAADTLSGVTTGSAAVKYRVDGKGEWTTVAAKDTVEVTAEAGRRYIEVQATDAAGNVMAKPQRFDITVPDGSGSAPRTPQTVGGDSQITLADRGELNGAGASAKATLTAWFVRKSSKDKKRDLTVRTIGERNTAAIQGTLINGDNQPIRNARIDLQASIAGGRVETSKDVARTDNEGNFAIKLNKGQTSRKLAVRYVERVNDEVATSAVGLELVVKARVALSVHAPKRGNRWKLSGFVSSGYLTKQGVQVQLQWRSPRDGWTDLRTVRTDAKGRFKYFRRMSGHYRLRARVASTPAYAYKGNVSRTVRGGGRR